MNFKEIPAAMCERWGVVKKRKQIHVVIAPKEQDHVEKNVQKKLEAHRNLFHADLGGVLLSYDKVEVRRKDLSELPRWSHLCLPTEADFILFHPRKGLELDCVVKWKEENFVECLFMGLFRVHVSRPAGVKVWEGDRMEMGMLVKVEIMSVTYNLYNVPVMQGRIVDSLEKEIGVDVVEEFQGVDYKVEVKDFGRKIKREREDDEDGRRGRKRRKMEKKLRKLECGNFSNAVDSLESISVGCDIADKDQEELKRQKKKEKKYKKVREEKGFEAASTVELNPDKAMICEANDVQEPKITGLVLVERQSELNKDENHSGEKLDDNSEIRKKKRKKKKDKKQKRYGISLVPEKLDEKDCEMDQDFSQIMDRNSVNDVVEETASYVESASNIESSVNESKKKENEKSSQERIKETRPTDDASNEELKESLDKKLDNNERKKHKNQKENKSKRHGIHLDPDRDNLTPKTPKYVAAFGSFIEKRSKNQTPMSTKRREAFPNDFEIRSPSSGRKEDEKLLHEENLIMVDEDEDEVKHCGERVDDDVVTDELSDMLSEEVRTATIDENKNIVRRSGRRTASQIKSEMTEKMNSQLRKDNDNNMGLAVKMFPEKGRGVVMTRDRVKGQFVVEYVGDILTLKEPRRREEEYRKDKTKGCYMYYFKHQDVPYYMDGTVETGRLGRLLNHSRLYPNCDTKVVTLDALPRLIFVTKKDITGGTELVYDYGDRDPETIKAHPWLAL